MPLHTSQVAIYIHICPNSDPVSSVIEDFITWRSNNHHKLSVSNTNELGVDFAASNMGVAAAKGYIFKKEKKKKKDPSQLCNLYKSAQF